MDDSGRRAEVTSTFQVFRTRLDGGATELYAVGRYFDTVDCSGEAPKLVARHVRLDTRDLHWGTHLPV
jgi:methanesulfonate monooxygenase small subunit